MRVSIWSRISERWSAPGRSDWPASRWLHLACSLPLVLLILSHGRDRRTAAGANPQLYIRDVLGEWGLRLLLLTLAVTPLRRLTGKPWPLLFRRLLGLWAFAYLALHFVTYFFLDRSLDLAVIVEDILKRPYITLGHGCIHADDTAG